MAVLSDAIIHDLLASRPAAGEEGRLFFPSDVGATYAYYDDGAAWQTINIQGPTGSTGAAGAAATISVGSTATGSAGSSAIVSNSGTSSAAVLDFVVPQGAAGAAGAAGADGKTLRNGTGAPASGLGVDGDFYIDTAAEAIYGPKTSGAWGSSTSLVGPAGSSGGSGVVTATTPLAYNSGTQTVSIQQSSGSQAGYLSSGDWTTFNSKLSTAPLVIGFSMGSGATGTGLAYAVAPRAGTVSKCKILVKSSDGSTDLTFKIKQNGTDVFSSDPTITHGASAGSLTTSTSLTSVPLTIAADDILSLDITSGTASWQFTAQLES